MSINIGVIGLQGAVSEHIDSVKAAGANAFWLRTRDDIDKADGIIIPGGESTTITKLLIQNNLFDKIKTRILEGMPVFGTCAGLIILSQDAGVDAQKTGQRLMGVIEISVERNAFGGQRESFELPIKLKPFSTPYPCVFIRAPIITKAGPNVEVLGHLEDKIIAARKDNILVTAFHPELTTDLRIHKYFLSFFRAKQ